MAQIDSSETIIQVCIAANAAAGCLLARLMGETKLRTGNGAPKKLRILEGVLSRSNEDEIGARRGESGRQFGKVGRKRELDRESE